MHTEKVRFCSATECKSFVEYIKAVFDEFQVTEKGWVVTLTCPDEYKDIVFYIGLCWRSGYSNGRSDTIHDMF